jgi:hypothetical protein
VYRKPLAPPEPIDALLVDVLVAPKERPASAVAIAWVFLGQSLQLLLQLEIAVGLRLILKRRTMQLN